MSAAISLSLTRPTGLRSVSATLYDANRAELYSIVTDVRCGTRGRRTHAMERVYFPFLRSMRSRSHIYMRLSIIYPRVVPVNRSGLV